MKLYHNLPWFIAFCLLGLSCQRIILGPEESLDSNNLFELFWNEINDHSGLIHIKNIDWVSVYDQYKPTIHSGITEEELFQTFIEMIDVFDDEHTVLFDRSGVGFASGAHRIEDAIQSFSKDLVRQKYLETFEEFHPNFAPDFSYGKIKGENLGYIYIGDTDGSSPDQLMDQVLKQLGDSDAIIFDVRNNGGGQGSFAIGVTDAFAEETRLIFTSQTRNGPGYDDFDEKTEFFNTSDGLNQYNKPVVVLTDAFTVSGAEHITAALKVNSHVTHVGDTTAGAFSSLSNRRFLPNGWSFQFPIQISLDPNGNSLDGEGIAPDLYIKNTPTDMANGRDRVIEAAIDLLK